MYTDIGDCLVRNTAQALCIDKYVLESYPKLERTRSIKTKHQEMYRNYCQ